MRLTLEDARKLRQLTPEELAQRTAIHRATIYRLLAGQIRNPSNDTVRKLEAALALDPGTLVFGNQSAVAQS